MTYSDSVRFASRITAVYLGAWAVSDAFGLVRELVSFFHYLNARVTSGNFAPYRWISMLAVTALKVLLWLAVAIWFYRCGPGVQKIFGYKPEQELASTENGQ